MEAPMGVRMFSPPIVAEPMVMVVVVVPELVADTLAILSPLISPFLSILDSVRAVVGQPAFSQVGPRGKLAGTVHAAARSILEKVGDGGARDPGCHAGAKARPSIAARPRGWAVAASGKL
jgi:hypothetical protein